MDDNVERAMKERAIRFMERDQKLQKEKEEKIANEFLEKMAKVQNFVEYVSKTKNSLILRVESARNNIPIVLSSCITMEFVQKSEEIIPTIRELDMLDEIKPMVFELWDIIQDLANKKIHVVSDIDKQMIRNVELKIKQIFEIFDLGPVQFKTIMDDSKDLELARHIQSLVNSNCSDLEINHGFENFEG